MASILTIQILYQSTQNAYRNMKNFFQFNFTINNMQQWSNLFKSTKNAINYDLVKCEEILDQYQEPSILNEDLSDQQIHDLYDEYVDISQQTIKTSIVLLSLSKNFNIQIDRMNIITDNHQHHPNQETLSTQIYPQASCVLKLINQILSKATIALSNQLSFIKKLEEKLKF
ncbi:hypothetical protein AB837_00441 [bacterium AB1]|nr:hypothetical protein AB837_00441 [bacterium AB1]